MEITELDKAYIAGLFDGEGCIFIMTDKLGGFNLPPAKRISITIANTNREILEWIHSLIGGWISGIYKNKYNKIAVSYIKFEGLEKSEIFLKLVLPYLRIKRQQALVAMEFIDFKKQIRENRIIMRNENNYQQRYRARSPELIEKEYELSKRVSSFNSGKGKKKKE